LNQYARIIYGVYLKTNGQRELSSKNNKQAKNEDEEPPVSSAKEKNLISHGYIYILGSK
jgi:hypothetical protein